MSEVVPVLIAGFGFSRLPAAKWKSGVIGFVGSTNCVEEASMPRRGGVAFQPHQPR